MKYEGLESKVSQQNQSLNVKFTRTGMQLCNSDSQLSNSYMNKTPHFQHARHIRTGLLDLSLEALARCWPITVSFRLLQHPNNESNPQPVFTFPTSRNILLN